MDQQYQQKVQNQPNQPQNNHNQDAMIIQQQQSISFSQILNPVSHKYTQIDSTNFVKSLRMGKNSKFMCIFEQNPFTIQIRNITNCQVQPYKISITNQDKSSQIKYYAFDISNQVSSILAQIQFQSVPYDCIEIKDGLWIISTKGMPARLYKKMGDGQHISEICHVGSFCNKKKNSQLYLSPIQMGVHANRQDCVIGGGMRFLCSYNMQKMVNQHYGLFDRSNISALEMIDQNNVIVGTFQGQMSIFDIRSPKQFNHPKQQQQNPQYQQLTTFPRPHVDAIMSIVSCPTNQHIFASSARKDNYLYIWDIRKYGQKGIITQYLHQLTDTRNGNQRISMCFSGDGTQLYSGSEQSAILKWKYGQDDQNNSQRWRIANNSSTTVSSVIYDPQNNMVICSTGSRKFDQIHTSNSDSDMDDLSHHNPHQNMISYIKLPS